MTDQSFEFLISLIVDFLNPSELVVVQHDLTVVSNDIFVLHSLASIIWPLKSLGHFVIHSKSSKQFIPSVHWEFAWFSDFLIRKNWQKLCRFHSNLLQYSSELTSQVSILFSIDSSVYFRPRKLASCLA